MSWLLLKAQTARQDPAKMTLWLQVQAAEERAALAENAIREEVSAEMGDLLREMEATYKVSPHLP